MARLCLLSEDSMCRNHNGDFTDQTYQLRACTQIFSATVDGPARSTDHMDLTLISKITIPRNVQRLPIQRSPSRPPRLLKPKDHPPSWLAFSVTAIQSVGARKLVHEVIVCEGSIGRCTSSIKSALSHVPCHIVERLSTIQTISPTTQPLCTNRTLEFGSHCGSTEADCQAWTACFI